MCKNPSVKSHLSHPALCGTAYINPSSKTIPHLQLFMVQCTSMNPSSKNIPLMQLFMVHCTSVNPSSQNIPLLQLFMVQCTSMNLSPKTVPTANPSLHGAMPYELLVKDQVSFTALHGTMYNVHKRSSKTALLGTIYINPHQRPPLSLTALLNTICINPHQRPPLILTALLSTIYISPHQRPPSF